MLGVSVCILSLHVRMNLIRSVFPADHFRNDRELVF